MIAVASSIVFWGVFLAMLLQGWHFGDSVVTRVLQQWCFCCSIVFPVTLLCCSCGCDGNAAVIFCGIVLLAALQQLCC